VGVSKAKKLENVRLAPLIWLPILFKSGKQGDCVLLANEPHRFRFPNGKHMAVVQHHNDGPVEIRPLDALFECFNKVFYLSKKQSADGVIDRATFSAAGPISRKIGSLSVSLPNEFPMKCSTQSSQQIKKQSAPNLFKPPHQGVSVGGWRVGVAAAI
jgi:hypothetical protein